MQIIAAMKELRAARHAHPGTFGLVPTMGFLHQGHLSLVKRARQECDRVGVSIFVNPTQFGPTEDLQKYPRDLDRDLALLEKEGVDIVWTPTADIVYPPGYQTYVTVEKTSQPLEGKQRPGHFRGVATVVAKLFNVFTPTRAYFGQKDAQQVAVIRQMVTDLNFPVEIVVCPIVREADGLAMSSRNVYLNPQEREAATVLYRSLAVAKALYDSGERDANRLRAAMSDTLAKEPLARPEYVSVADPVTLAELERATEGALLSMAVRLGTTRLIDNMILA